MANEYKFVDTSADSLVTSMVSAYEEIIGRSLSPASPERLFIGWCADVIVQTRELINFAANQNIPSRAVGENLDALAEVFYAQTRPAAVAAQCTMRFTISAVQASAVIVPAGTRISDPDLTLIWETVEDAQIDAGNTTVDVTAVCQTVGDIGNGWTVGQITELIDVFSYYQSCQNITESDGGSDQANDGEFYTRLRESEDGYSTAGASGSYAYWAKTASTDIADVVVIRPEETVTKTLTVYDHHAFLGGDNLKAATLTVSYNGSQLVKDTDYTVQYVDGLLTITLLSGSDAYGAASLSVSVGNTLAGEVWLYGLMSDGSAPSDEIKARMLAICNSDEVRPLTDKVSVKSPTTVSYNINLTYYIPQGESASAIAAAVASAVEEYKAWQSGKLGRDINPSKLISLLMATGIKRVNVTSPDFKALADGTNNTPPELAAVGSVTVTNGGFEYE